ncbi:Bug family tripartite tricarboxylate transporter substrate binding protein [Chelatococcus asaccharovorans]|uniref:Tripartite-type tricarboxylate transporter receptor subunit TctC n=1 Tax=Chelatococcus asaccharovorans TaxID=28210 RepID=A0A2V3TRX4_9HYPH|nr:tripartite tricarboxylate transporter substrate binding protein [Chelatococcus asaccharovorans]MBS7708134.1 tripartite tricarboxylate transporter substrate binding protein [Chelatococcus asaccharovorans]PXW50696.1 tripartite-type tricarboxylate transporter receptor subunit TctC [Chelatococcus asaccharovorans]
MFNFIQTSRCSSLLGALLGAALVGATAAPALAEFPERPVTIVVPFSPGSGTDTGTRVLSTVLEPLLGQPIVVDNRPGGSGALAASLVAQAPADGYMLLMGTNSTQSANPLLIKNLGYDPKEDFRPIGMIATFEMLLAVNAGFPAQTAEELVAYARENPGKVTYATGNVTGLVAGSLFASRLGLDMLRVPYKSNAEALTDLVGGQVDVMFPDIAASMPYVTAGSLRALSSVTLGEVSPLAPDLVPLSQTLVPELKLVGWIGLFAPADTSDAVIARLASALEQAVNAGEFRSKLLAVGANANFLPPEALAEHIAAERERFATIFESVGMEPQ